MTPTGFWGQRSGFGGVQIAVNGASAEVKATGGLGFGAARLDEFHDTFPQVQCISFHAHNLCVIITLCATVNMNYYILAKARFENCPVLWGQVRASYLHGTLLLYV